MLNTNPVKQPGFLTITEVPLIGEKTFRGSAILRMVKLMGHGMKMLVGMPDYDNYVQHMQERHPELPVMSYETFFRERQQARYGGDGKGGGMRCC